MFYVGPAINVPEVKSNSTADVLPAYKTATATVRARVHRAPGGRWVWRSLSSRSLSLVGRRHTRLWAPRGQESAPSSVPHAQHLSSAGAAGWSTANPRELWGLEEQAEQSQKSQGQKPRKKSVLQVEETFHVYREFSLGERKGSRKIFSGPKCIRSAFAWIQKATRSQWKVLEQQHYFLRKLY